MSLFFRILLILIRAYYKPPISLDQPVSKLTMYVLPNDLDINFHMNNGRYLTICDLSRIDLFTRGGLLKPILKNKWRPVVAEHTMTYKKPLQLFQRYQLSCEVTHWDEKYFYMIHTFEHAGEIAAAGTSKGCIVGKDGVLSPEIVISAAKKMNQNLS